MAMRVRKPERIKFIKDRIKSDIPKYITKIEYMKSFNCHQRTCERRENLYGGCV